MGDKSMSWDEFKTKSTGAQCHKEGEKVVCEATIDGKPVICDVNRDGNGGPTVSCKAKEPNAAV